MSLDLVIGIDLGGTQLRMGAVNSAGKLVTEIFSTTTGVEITEKKFLLDLRQLWSDLEAMISPRQVRACGVGVAGVVRGQKLVASDNVPLLVNPELGAQISAALNHVPVRIENDARCFLFGEARFGAGRGARNACGITLGTGVGGAVMTNGTLVTGVNAEAGEVWRIPCRDNVLEYFVSGVGLVRGYLAAGGQPSQALTAVEIARRARAGDPAAIKAWQSYGDDVYTLCETMIALLEPEVIILGGSMANACDLFGRRFHEQLAGRATRIAYAELDAAAGLIGAAALHFE